MAGFQFSFVGFLDNRPDYQCKREQSKQVEWAPFLDGISVITSNAWWRPNSINANASKC